jgi:biopolymer transport protein ExbB/TolQ
MSVMGLLVVVCLVTVALTVIMYFQLCEMHRKLYKLEHKLNIQRGMIKRQSDVCAAMDVEFTELCDSLQRKVTNLHRKSANSMSESKRVAATTRAKVVSATRVKKPPIKKPQKKRENKDLEGVKL